MHGESKTLLILSGGRGVRFGGDKGLSLFEGTAMIKRVLDSLSPLADRVVVSVAPGASPGYCKILGDSAVVIEDVEAHKGPLVGLKDALSHVSGDILILSACDMPFMKADLYKLLLGRLGRNDAAMPFIGGYNEPIMGVYRLAKLRKAIDLANAKSEVKLSAILNALDFVKVSEEDMSQAGLDPKVFTNLNNPSFRL